jgi:hypothetical protein
VSNFSFDLPADEREWEWESKGYYPGARLTVSGKHYSLNFYDPVRLGQEIQGEFERGLVFSEPNLVVIKSVTRADMEQAAEQLVQSGRLAFLVAE